MPVAILGLGNLLLTDDGVGVHALRALAADPPPPPSSLHDLDLPALVRTLPSAARPPIPMVGIQPDVIALGTSLSPVVSASLPVLLREVRALALSQKR